MLDKQPLIQTTKSGRKIPESGQPSRVAHSNSRSELKAPPKQSIEVSHLDPKTFLKFLELPRDLSFIIFDEYIRERKSRTIVIHCAKRSQRTPVNEQDGNYASPVSAKYLPPPLQKPTANLIWRLWKTRRWRGHGSWGLRSAPYQQLFTLNREFCQLAQRFYKLGFGYQLGGRPVWFDLKKTTWSSLLGMHLIFFQARDSLVVQKMWHQERTSERTCGISPLQT
jgi:hypothetical protein